MASIHKLKHNNQIKDSLVVHSPLQIFFLLLNLKRNPDIIRNVTTYNSSLTEAFFSSLSKDQFPTSSNAIAMTFPSRTSQRRRAQGAPPTSSHSRELKTNAEPERELLRRKRKWLPSITTSKKGCKSARATAKIKGSSDGN